MPHFDPRGCPRVVPVIEQQLTDFRTAPAQPAPSIGYLDTGTDRALAQVMSKRIWIIDWVLEQPGNRSLADWKAYLLAEHKAGRLELVRCDMPGALSADEVELMQVSELTSGVAVYHKVRIK